MAGNMQLFALRARYGDCFVLRYEGKGAKKTYILIDGGPPKTWKESLEPFMGGLAGSASRLPINLCVLTHADEDHVGGLIEFFRHIKKNPNQFNVMELWMNAYPDKDGPQEIGVTKEALLESVKQGQTLYGLAKELSIPVNSETRRDEVRDGINLTVVAPGAEELKKLEKMWAKKASSEAILESCTDNSITNLSSIAVLVEKGGSKLLLCGDARGDKILTGLEETKKLEKDGKLELDLLKIPHHGGKHNVDEEFFMRLPARQYLVSTNGEKFGHPDPEMFRLLLEARKKVLSAEKFQIFITYGFEELDPETKLPEIKELIGNAKAAGLKFSVEKLLGHLEY